MSERLRSRRGPSPAEHIETLAAEHDIRIVSVSAEDCCHANRHGNDWLIRVEPINDLIGYYTALHEIGHLLGKGGWWKSLLEREANAWVYAIETATWPTTYEVRQLIRDALSGYAGYRSGLSLPPEDHPFWVLLEHGDLTPSAIDGIVKRIDGRLMRASVEQRRLARAREALAA